MCDRPILRVRRSSPIMEAIWFQDNTYKFKETCQWVYRKGNFEVFPIGNEGVKIVGHGNEVTALNGTWIVYDDTEGFMVYRHDLFMEMFEENSLYALGG